MSRKLMKFADLGDEQKAVFKNARVTLRDMSRVTLSDVMKPNHVLFPAVKKEYAENNVQKDDGLYMLDLQPFVGCDIQIGGGAVGTVMKDDVLLVDFKNPEQMQVLDLYVFYKKFFDLPISKTSDSEKSHQR